MKNPLVTVLMTIYNGEQYIKSAIESVRKQTYQYWELVIVVEADTNDDTCKIIQSFKDTRIRQFRNDTRLGLDESLNRGLSLAKGKYIARLDDDDICMPDRLEIQVKVMESNPKLMMCGSNAFIINSDNKIISIEHTPRRYEDICHHLLFENCFISSAVMFRSKNIIGKWKYNGIASEDYLLWAKIASKYEVLNIQKELVAYREYNGNRTKEFIQVQEKRDALIQKTLWKKRKLKSPINKCFYCEFKGKRELKIREEMLKEVLIQSNLGLRQRKENIKLAMELYHTAGMNDDSACQKIISEFKGIYPHKKLYLYKDIMDFYLNKQIFKLLDEIKIYIRREV